MDRCELANAYHDRGFNCAQSVLAAFGDLTHLPEKEALALAGGFGGGIGGSHEEVCGAMSGALMVLGTLYPHTEERNLGEKQRIYRISKEFQARFKRCFGFTSCKDLLAAKIQTDYVPTARRLHIQQHCAILIVTAVEIVETMLREAGVLQSA